MKKNTFLFAIVAGAAFLLCSALPAKTEVTDDRQAMEILLDMATTLAEAERFSVTLKSRYDALQPNGQMVEFEAVREIRISRPDNRMRIDLRRSNGAQRVMIFDGKQILIHSVTDNVYAKAEKVGSVDDAIKYLVGILKTPLPLARMFRTTFPAELEQLVEEIDVVERNALTDGGADHLAARTRDVDFQIWIARDKAPLPRRVVITYKNARGAPQFRAEFSNWHLNAEEPFPFTLPEDAEQVPLLIRDRNRGKRAHPGPEGGKP